MLSLTRSKGQRIVVTHEPSGDSLTIEVNQLKDTQVRLGFFARKTFLIDREEIHDKKARTK